VEIVRIVMEILLVRAESLPETGRLLATELARSGLARLTKRIAGKEQPPLVAAAQSVLRLLQEDERRILQERIFHRFAIE
jgi:hypothetical protein